MKILKIQLFLLIACFGIIQYSIAQEDCLPKNENRLVNDYVGSLSVGQRQDLEAKLVQYALSTSTQIAIVIVSDLCDYDIASYTFTLAEEWGVGQKGSDNGVMIMVKPTGGAGQRQTFIAVGYGLEGVIPDAIAKRIVAREMKPRFKNNDIYGGLDAATNVIMKLAEGEFTAEDYNKQSAAQVLLPVLFFFLITLIIIVAKFKQTSTYARRNNIGFWMALMLMSSSSRGRSGGFGGFRSGGGSFGGFGGGSFGGGGAGGSW
ncbi:MAG: TPM domain-containing protein [Bacteroidales bacterium]|nr:TPM domain-containing protein [Bacteroidales bacterium]